LGVDSAAWLEELPSLREHLATFGEHLPPELPAQLAALEARLRA
jgi:phosphoenolpyruvate carboxykinase (GTP)